MHSKFEASQSVNKIALSANDDKQFVCEDGVKTLAWGHWRLEKSCGKISSLVEVHRKF